MHKYINIIRTFYEQSDAKNSFVTVLRSDYFTVMRNGASGVDIPKKAKFLCISI